MSAANLADRLERMRSESDANGCRHWLGYINPRTGYGQVTLSKADAESFGSRVITAPVLACTLAHGSRPDGAHVLHSCDVRSCCADEHLRWGTPGENANEAWERGRQQKGERHHQARLTDAQVAEVCARARAGERVVDIAAEYGVDWSQVYAWLRGEARREAVTQ